MNWRKLGPTTVKGRDRLRTVLILLAAGLGGYLVTLVAYPAPLISRDQPLGRLLGLPLAEAQRDLAEAGLKVRLEGEEADPVIPAGHVTWQDPPPGTQVPVSSMVRLTVSAGPAPISVPDVTGFEVEQARQVIEAAGLQVGEVDAVPNAAEAGVVVATRPPTGTTRPPGSRVGLLTSEGPADIRVPDLVGLEQEEARRRLESAGLRVGRITSRAGEGRPGAVLEQRPAAGAFIPREGRVDLVVGS